MIDYLYAKEQTFDLAGQTIECRTGSSLIETYTLTTDGLTYKEIIEEIIAGFTDIDVSMDTEFLKFISNTTKILRRVIIVNESLRALLGGIDESTYVDIPIEGIAYMPTWGYKLPRTTIHELASLQGGFKTRQPIEMYRQRETKVTKEATYSTNYAVRRGFTHTYRLDFRYVDYFDLLLDIWKDELITATNEDMNVPDGYCISTDSGNLTQVYEIQNIFEITITLLGA